MPMWWIEPMTWVGALTGYRTIPFWCMGQHCNQMSHPAISSSSTFYISNILFFISDLLCFMVPVSSLFFLRFYSFLFLEKRERRESERERNIKVRLPFVCLHRAVHLVFSYVHLLFDSSLLFPNLFFQTNFYGKKTIQFCYSKLLESLFEFLLLLPLCILSESHFPFLGLANSTIGVGKRRFTVLMANNTIINK